MAYEAKVLPVMIASPSDVADEREIVREVLSEWNAVYSEERGVVLLPVGWDTHSSPDLAGRPQELINERVLANADLLVGIFWTRVGSHTGKAISGSVEEIEKHLEAGKAVMLYFSNQPVHPNSVNSDQYKALNEFKAWATGRGLIEEFESADQFRSKFRRHLPIILRDNAHLKSCVSTSAAAPLPSLEDVPLIDIGRYVRPAPEMSADAAELLKAAVGRGAHILVLDTLDGSHIQTGGKAFGDGGQRESARWKAALSELVEAGLVEAKGHKGQVFATTHAGYQYAEQQGWPVEG